MLFLHQINRIVNKMIQNANLSKLSVRDRETYYGQQVRQYFERNNTRYDIGSDGCSSSHLITHQVPVKEFYSVARDRLKIQGISIPAFSEHRPLTEPVKKLFRDRSLSNQIDRFLTKHLGPLFQELAAEARARRAPVPVTIVHPFVPPFVPTPPPPIEEEASLIQRRIRETLESFSEDCWD
jgi:hypothetical protein